VDFYSAAALGKLITLEKKVKANGGVLKLSNIRPEIYEVFAITRLNRLFDIKDDEGDALAAF
jgi:anti-sigma B factor antagonist